MQIKRIIFILFIVISLMLISCGGNYKISRELEFSNDEINTININYYTKEEDKWYNLEITDNDDIKYAYKELQYIYTKEDVRSNYKTNEKECYYIYEVNFSLKGKDDYLIKYYVYSNVDGTVVYQNKEAYAFYGNARCSTYKNIKGYIDNKISKYYLNVEPNNCGDVVMNLPKSGYYEAGHKFDFYIQVVTDVEFYASLNGKRFTYPPSDATVGGYCKYSFEMPKENSNLKIDVLTSDIIYLKYIYDWINDIKLEDISMVFSCDKNYSIAPSLYELDRIYYSDDENDLKNVYDYLNNTYLQGVNYDLRIGVETKTMCIVTKNGDKYVLSTYDGTIYNQELDMIISKNLPSFYRIYGYSFPGNSLFSIKALDSLDSNTDVTSYFKNMGNLKNMIFKEVNNVSFDTSINDYNRYKFTNYLGEIIFETEEYFKVNTEGIIKTYQIINEYKFSSLK